MDAFSYLSVLLSIILGLAMQQILQGYRALILSDAKIGKGWIAIAWSVLLLLFVTQAWWASFGLRTREHWGFLQFAVILLQMALLYMMAGVILPDVHSGEAVDLDAHFERHRKAFYGFLIAVVVTSLLKDLLLDGRWPLAGNLAFHLTVIVASSLGIAFARRRVQIGIIAAISLAFLTYVVMLFAQL